MTSAVSRSGLGLSWIAGLTLGIHCFRTSGSRFAEMIVQSCTASRSPMDIFLILSLPLLLSALAAVWDRCWLFLPLALWKGFCLGFISMGVCVAFGSAGWLVCFLLLFSDLSLAGVLYGYWLRQLNRGFCPVRLMTAFALALIPGCIDHHYFAPLLMRILQKG